eukprot:59401-Amphidinium_carterae.1
MHPFKIKALELIGDDLGDDCVETYGPEGRTPTIKRSGSIELALRTWSPQMMAHATMHPEGVADDRTITWNGSTPNSQ